MVWSLQSGRSVTRLLPLSNFRIGRVTFRLIASNAAWSLLAHALGRGSLVLTSIILARHLNTADFAAYSYFQITVSMLAAYSDLGLGVAASRFFAEISSVSLSLYPPVGALWILSILVGVSCALIVIIVPASWIDGGLEIPQPLLSVGVLVMVLGIIPSGGILGLERYREATVAAAAAALIIIVGGVIAGVAGSAILAIWAFLFAALSQAAGNALVIVRRVGARRLVASVRFGKAELTRIVGFAGPMTAVTLLAASGSWIIGRMLLSHPSGEHEFRLFAIGLQWYALALMLPGMVSRVILPRLVRSRLESGAEISLRVRTVTRNGVGASLIAALVVCLAAALLSPWLWSLYGINDNRGAWLIVVFLCAAIPAAPANTIGNAIVANDGQWTWFGISGAWFVCLMWAAKELLPFGAIGGAVALLCGSLLMSVLSVSVAYRRGLI
jgi:O-antigen/teichoic acid export membrane protein